MSAFLSEYQEQIALMSELGKRPFQESETACLLDFVEKVLFRNSVGDVVCAHTSAAVKRLKDEMLRSFFKVARKPTT